MRVYSALYEQQHDPFGITKETPVCVTSPDAIPEDAKGYLLLHGGEDISPSIYGEKNNTYCHASTTPSRRDQLELALIKRAREIDLPIVGICRGAQLLCCVDGGKLAQHIVGHHDVPHVIINPNNGQELGKSNTAHHQMMIPRYSKMTRVLGVVNSPVLSYSENNTLREHDNVPEIVVFNKLKAFGVQFHPEWMKPSDTIVDWCRRYIIANLIKE